MIPKLEVSGVSYSYHPLDGETLALSDISFTVNTGEFLAIVGPSGCGKSTLLTMLCGLTTPDSGAILLDGNPLTRDASAIGYMLQKDHLFEWRTIFSNVSLGLEIQKRLDEPAKHELQAMINTYGLGGFENAYPSELSGGMRQRAALIRTLALKPELLLLDAAVGEGYRDGDHLGLDFLIRDGGIPGELTEYFRPQVPLHFENFAVPGIVDRPAWKRRGPMNPNNDGNAVRCFIFKLKSQVFSVPHNRMQLFGFFMPGGGSRTAPIFRKTLLRCRGGKLK